MSEFTDVIDNGKTSAEGFKKHLNQLFSAGISAANNPTSLQALQRGSGANMSVDVQVGQAMLELPTKLFSYWCWIDAVKNVVVGASDPANPRVDTLVSYVDPSVASSSNINSSGSYKFAVIAGIPAGSPVSKSDTEIQAALGATSAWQKHAYIYVGAGVASITSGNITDFRSYIAPLIPVGAANIAAGAITLGYAQITANQSTNSTSQVQVAGLSATVNIPQGGRKIRITAYSVSANAGPSTTAVYSIWDGPVGTGTQIGQANITSGNQFLNLQTIVTPSAGSKTYNVGFSTTVSANGALIAGQSTAPAFILVEAI